MTSRSRWSLVSVIRNNAWPDICVSLPATRYNSDDDGCNAAMRGQQACFEEVTPVRAVPYEHMTNLVQRSLKPEHELHWHLRERQ